MGWLFLALLVASCSAICENSPYSVTQLRGFLAAALKDLSTPSFSRIFPFIPNLVSGTNTAKDCDPTKGQISNCGYPAVFTTSTSEGGKVEESWHFLQNPDIGYAGALINQTKILHPTDPTQLADVATQIDCGDAIIWFGCTPVVTYYAYSKLLWAMNPPLNSSATQILGSLGDSVNNFRIKTVRINSNISGGGATLIVYTAYNKTYEAITNAFSKAGFPVSGMNVDPLPTSLIQLGKKGAYLGFGSRNSNLTLAETAYLFTPGTGYFAQNELNFPYVHLRPIAGSDWLYCCSGDEISPLPVWIPAVNTSQSVPSTAVMAQSEHVYEPHLLSAVSNITVALTKALASLSSIFHFTIYPQLGTYIEEFGERYIFEHKYAQHGGGGTRDNDYFLYHPGLVPIYGTLNFSIIVGLRHESPNWKALGKATPHATFWNIAYSDSTAVGALMRFNQFDSALETWSTLPNLGAAVGGDPLNVIWVRTTGVTSNTPPQITQVLSALTPNIPHDNSLANIAPLTGLHHAYVNPDTGVAPWTGSILPPIQIHVVGVKIA